MAGTQPLPSWMTLSTVVITNSNGQPIATSTTTLELPLTYYGPSIPLGTDGAWTWGGLTPPASSTSTSTSTSTPTSSTATPTTPSTLTPPPNSSSHPSSTSTLTTSTASTTSVPFSSNLSTGAIIGIILGAIVGFNLLLLAIVCFLRHRARRARNPQHPTPIWTHWEVVSPSAPPDEQRPAGVGSPRDSGEEADSFLQQSRGGSGRARTSGPVAALPPGAAPPRVAGSAGSGDSGHTGSSAVTDYGVLLPGGGPIGQAYRDDAHFPARASSEMVGYIMPPGELLKIDDEEPLGRPRMYGIQRPSDPSFPEAFAPLLPPPPLDIDRLSTRKTPSLNEKEKSVRSLSYPASDMEDPKVYTARRVKVKELGPRSPTDETFDERADDDPVPGPSRWRDSFGLSSLSRLRKSWFGGSSSRDTSKSSGGHARTDEAEVSRSLLGVPRIRSRVGLGLTGEGERPMSSVSAKSAISGNSVYHDAVSRLGTPVSVPSRAMTPASTRGPASSNGLAPPLPTGAPPAYALSDPYDSIGSRGSILYSQGVDALDLPVPQPASSFAASGGTSTATRSAVTPPGLGDSQSRTWHGTLSVITGSSDSASITIDVLDAEPPTAQEGWRSMAGSLGASTGETGVNPGGRQAASGRYPQVVHQAHPTRSDQGSLHSMHSHLSPHSRSSESAPVSSKYSHVHFGSNSSRQSGYSRIQTASSGSVHSGSLSSFGRRRGGAISPSVSAFGGTIESGGLSPLDEILLPTPQEPNRMSVLGPMPSFVHSMTAPTIQSVGATTTSDDTDITRMTSTTLTTGTGTEATSLNLDNQEDELPKYRLGTFDFERVRT